MTEDVSTEGGEGSLAPNEMQEGGAGFAPTAEIPFPVQPEVPTNGSPRDLILSVDATIRGGVEEILQAFERKIAYDQTKQLQVDRLHEELQGHRSNLAASVARPVVTGVIHIHDGISRLLAALRTKPPETLTLETLFKHLEEIQEDMELLLSHNGISTFREEGSTFDFRRQLALVKVPTQDPILADQVSASLRPGFEWGAQLLEKERVAVYTFQPPAPAADRAPVPAACEDTPPLDTEN